MNASRPSVRPTLDCWECGTPVMRATVHSHEGPRGGKRRCSDPACEEWSFKLGVVRRCKGCGVFWLAAPVNCDGVVTVELQRLRPERIECAPSVGWAAWRYPSRSKAGKSHEVVLRVQEGREWFECSCPGFDWKDSCAHAKHARLVWEANR